MYSQSCQSHLCFYLLGVIRSDAQDKGTRSNTSKSTSKNESKGVAIKEETEKEKKKGIYLNMLSGFELEVGDDFDGGFDEELPNTYKTMRSK
ncbi:hypothetical protein Gotur_006405 [Gossypium turneri]